MEIHYQDGLFRCFDKKQLITIIHLPFVNANKKLWVTTDNIGFLSRAFL